MLTLDWRNVMWILFLLGLFAGSPTAGASEASPPPDLTVSAIRGEASVRRRCAACHAVAADDQSPNPDAPPLREVAERYPVDNLGEAFAEGIMVAHDSTMPPFTLEAQEIADILAYLDQLNEERRERVRP